MLNLIVSKDNSFWPPASEMTKPHPMLVKLATNLLAAALYNYDQVTSGHAEDFVDILAMSKQDRAQYIAEVAERALRKGQ